MGGGAVHCCRAYERTHCRVPLYLRLLSLIRMTGFRIEVEGHYLCARRHFFPICSKIGWLRITKSLRRLLRGMNASVSTAFESD